MWRFESLTLSRKYGVKRKVSEWKEKEFSRREDGEAIALLTGRHESHF
jgi:hypothetical protein